MTLPQEEVNMIKRRRADVEDIKQGIESEHVNSDADLVRVFQAALRRAETCAALNRSLKTKMKP